MPADVGRVIDELLAGHPVVDLSLPLAEDGGPTHVAGLSRGMVFVEALTGLDALPPRGAWFLFLPVRVVDGTGAPGRAVAVLPRPLPEE